MTFNLALSLALLLIPFSMLVMPRVARRSNYRHQQKRERYAQQAQLIEERNQSERIRGAILSHLHDNELSALAERSSISEEAIHVSR